MICGLQWDKVENKTSVAVYAGGAVVALWLSSTIVGAVNAVPLVRVTLDLGEREQRVRQRPSQRFCGVLNTPSFFRVARAICNFTREVILKTE